MVEIEIMAPAGSFESLQAAIQAGAGSVYFGVEQLNMRARAANNFSLKDLKEIAKKTKKVGVKSYLTLNTVMYDHDLVLIRKICAAAKTAKVDAIIASDIATMQIAREYGLSIHLSTQVNVSNIEAVKFFAQFADVIVLARELTLKQITSIVESIKKENICGPGSKVVRVEIFAHGALCVAIAGKCHMSLATYNASANRGACLQNCRKAYKVIDEETGDELIIDNKYVMSPKDLCTIGFLDKILDAGVSVLKIEGRGRSPEYVYIVTKVYKEAVNSWQNKTCTKEKITNWMKQLEAVYNRGFWQGGYYLGKKLGEWSGSYGSQATAEKKYVGIVKNYYSKPKVALIALEAGELKIGSSIIIIGPTTGIIQTTIKELYKDDRHAVLAKKGEQITIPLLKKARKNDKLFIVVEKHG